MMNKIAEKAIQRYEADMGGHGCIGDASCECFRCEITRYAIGVDRAGIDAEERAVSGILVARDQLREVAVGLTPRERCVDGREAYGARRGHRKITLKDAKAIARSCAATLDRVVKEFEGTAQI